MALPSTASFPQSGSIVSRWKLDEESGTRADSVGSNDLTDNNTVLYAAVTDPLNNDGKAADFEAGNSESLSITDAAQSGLDFTTDLSFSAWMQWESTSSYGGIFAKYNGTGDNRSYVLAHMSTTNVFDFANVTNGAGDAGSGQVSFTPTLGQWYHVVFTFDASESGLMEMYIDGSSIGTDTTTKTSIYNGTAVFYLGSYLASTFHDGLMQDAIMWSVVLSSTEVSDLYELYTVAPSTGVPNSLMMLGVGT